MVILHNVLLLLLIFYIFNLVSHQKEMIKRGILKKLLNLIVCDCVSVQIKSFEVLMHFDGN
jgi:hypothetical protein